MTTLSEMKTLAEGYIRDGRIRREDGAAINVVLDDLVRADGRDESDFSHGYYTALDEAKYRIAEKLNEMGVE